MNNQFNNNYSIQPRTDSNDIFYGTMGEDFLLLTKLHPRQIWSVVEEDDTIYIAPGINHANRTKFFATIEGWESRNEVYYI